MVTHEKRFTQDCSTRQRLSGRSEVDKTDEERLVTLWVSLPTPSRVGLSRRDKDGDPRRPPRSYNLYVLFYTCVLTRDSCPENVSHPISLLVKRNTEPCLTLEQLTTVLFCFICSFGLPIPVSHFDGWGQVSQRKRLKWTCTRSTNSEGGTCTTIRLEHKEGLKIDTLYFVEVF